MQHIALITTSFPDGQPGSEAAGSFVADFASALGAHARVTVVAAGRRESRNDETIPAVVRFAVPRIPLSSLNSFNPRDWPAIVSTLGAGTRSLNRLIDADRPDHILALWALPSGHWAEQSARRHGIPYSTWALGSDIWSLGRIPLARGRLRTVLRSAAHNFADGLQLADDVERISGRRCEFLPSSRTLPIVPGEAVRTGPPYRLAYLGRWHPNKGTDLLMDALGRLDENAWKRIEEVRIFGGGPLSTRIEQGVRHLAGTGRPIISGGYLDKSAAAKLITWADYLLLPSRKESIPVIFSDAVQLGTPLIATPVGDLPRLHHDYEFGLLAGSASAEGFAAVIRSGLKLPASGFVAGLARAAGDFSLQSAAERFFRTISGHS